MRNLALIEEGKGTGAPELENVIEIAGFRHERATLGYNYRSS